MLSAVIMIKNPMLIHVGILNTTQLFTP